MFPVRVFVVGTSYDVGVESICHLLMMRSMHTFVCIVLLNTHNFVIRVRAGHKFPNHCAGTRFGTLDPCIII